MNEEIKHTPGPWSWRDHNSDDDCDSENEGLIVANGSIVTAGTRPNDADIALICAAPDMLASLIDARKALHYRYVEWDVEPVGAILVLIAHNMCDEAIKKATGQ